MEAYSLDLRCRVLALVDGGELSRTEIAELLQVSTAWIRRLVQRRREGMPPGSKAQRHGPPPSLKVCTETGQQRRRRAIRWIRATRIMASLLAGRHS